MKLAPAANHFEAFGIEEEVEMMIRPDEKTVRTLIHGMYSDKFGAVVRELATNGWDSHIEAGAPDRAVFVHCPHDLNPMFYVRDFGAGMSHEKMTGLYAVISASDKDQANDQAGGFGLGRLSPLGLEGVDQYSVTCFDGDVARNYTVAYGEKGIPKVLFNGATPSTEPRGVRVGFPVEKARFDTFKARIAKVALGFEPGALDSNAPADPLPEPVLWGEGWRRFQPMHQLATWNVRMGCVIYPLVADAQLLELPPDGGCWIIDAPIGAISLPRSREGIEYTEKNCAYIASRIAQIRSEVEAQMTDLVKDIPDYLTFRKTLVAARPLFFDTPIIHGPSGLAGDAWELDERSFLFRGHEGYEGGWEYEERRKIGFAPNATPAPRYVFRDVERLLSAPGVRAKAIDAKRFKEKGGLTYSERRRLARWWRTLCEYSYDEGVEGIEGEIDGWLLVTEASDAQLATVFPQPPVEISFEQIQAALDWYKPEARPRPALFDGVCAITVAAGYMGDDYVMTPIDTAEFEDNACWWPRAQLTGNKAAAFARIAAAFGLKLYSCAAGSRKVVAGAELPTLSEALDRKMLGLGLPLNWADYTSCYGAGANPLRTHNDYYSFFQRVLACSPELYRRMKTCPGVLGVLARGYEPFYQPEAEMFRALQSYEGRRKVEPRFPEFVKDELKLIPPNNAKDRAKPLARSQDGDIFQRAYRLVSEEKSSETKLLHGLMSTAMKTHGEAFLSLAETTLRLARRHAKQLPAPRRRPQNFI